MYGIRSVNMRQSMAECCDQLRLPLCVNLQELEQRQQRLRNSKAELLNLQRLEVVHLENFLDGQARAGKQLPLEEQGFKRSDGNSEYEYDLVGI